MANLTESKVEKIGSNTFYIRPFRAFKASRLSGELASVLAPVLGAVLPMIPSSADGNVDLDDIDLDKAGKAFASSNLIDGEKLEELTRHLLLGDHITAEFTNQDGNVEQELLNEDLIDFLFCGNIQDMFALCFAVVRLNFNGFFKNLPTLSGSLKVVGKTKKRKVI